MGWPRLLTLSLQVVLGRTDVGVVLSALSPRALAMGPADPARASPGISEAERVGSEV